MNKIESIIISLVNYVVLFIGIPFIVLPLTNEFFTLVSVCVWMVMFSIFCALKGKKAKYFLLRFLSLFCFVMFYHPNGIYGIDDGGCLDFSPAWLDALIVVFVICVVQYGITAAIGYIVRGK